MDIDKIKKWIANIEQFEPNLSLGTCKTLGDIKKELDNNSISLDAEVVVKTAEEMILRKLLWLRHGCNTYQLYGDDGEMQCCNCMIDFKRDTPEKIKNRWDELLRLKLKTDVGLQQELKILFNDSRFSE